LAAAIFDKSCRACPRLAGFLDDIQDRYPDYYCRPVPPFGAPDARFLIVGLAPGMHGANRTGRPFTGDHAGILLYQAATILSRPVTTSSLSTAALPMPSNVCRLITSLSVPR
jgi:uracil-DNA glycosylase